MSILRDKIRAADDIGREMVPVPEWDVTVEVRSPNARERAALLHLMAGQQDDEDARTAFFPMVVVGTSFDPETGEQLFGADDVDWLATKNGAAVARVASVGLRLAGLIAEAVDEGKDDSSETPTDGTDSISPNDSE